MAKKRLIVYLVLVTIVLLMVFLPGISQLHELRERNEELLRQVEELKADNEALRKDKELLLNDPVYLERIARERLKMGREGEIIYKIVPPEEAY